jgi:hypothetical protein
VQRGPFVLGRAQEVVEAGFEHIQVPVELVLLANTSGAKDTTREDLSTGRARPGNSGGLSLPLSLILFERNGGLEFMSNSRTLCVFHLTSPHSHLTGAISPFYR